MGLRKFEVLCKAEGHVPKWSCSPNGIGYYIVRCEVGPITHSRWVLISDEYELEDTLEYMAESMTAFLSGNIEIVVLDDFNDKPTIH